MESVAASSSAALASKRVVYVGGIPDEATEHLIRAAFVPFGNISNVYLPMDYVNGTHRGFAFVEMEEPDDASEAIFNMDGAELLSRTIRVSLAQPNQLNKLHQTSRTANNTAIWSSDEWFQQQQQQEEGQKADNDVAKTDLAALQEY
ncbi:hypothetical protein ACA910_016505 [Epithemia clementina (nom. ined.)]